jgi:hypothetical protein
LAAGHSAPPRVIAATRFEQSSAIADDSRYSFDPMFGWSRSAPTFVRLCTRSRSAALAGAVALLLLTPKPASAYCRESLESQSQGPCDPNPDVPFLFWQRSCVTYKFNNLMFARMALLGETGVRAAFTAAFKTWADVDCDGRQPFSVQQFSGTTTTSKAEFLYDVVNESVIVARTGDEWMNLPDHDANALALTLIWHDKNTGQIFDVDMELNTGAGNFNDCVARLCSTSMIDLQNTVTHEGGHLLGLGHSTVVGSTMEASTSTDNETTKRTLEQDDRDGYCSLDLPEFKCNGSNCTCPAPPIVSSKSGSSRCSCRTIGGPTRAIGASSAFALSTFALMFALRARRRRRQ